MIKKKRSFKGYKEDILTKSCEKKSDFKLILSVILTETARSSSIRRERRKINIFELLLVQHTSHVPVFLAWLIRNVMDVTESHLLSFLL